MNKILYMTLKKEWFDKIANKEKTYEFRELKPYWTSRLFFKDQPKVYNEIIFTNGYGSHVPTMRVKYLGVSVSEGCKDLNTEKPVFVIHLGEIIEIKNWQQPAKYTI